MPHKHNDIKHGVDPELIRRYLAGELDDKAMHLLEKQALDDPFLAEALDGLAAYAPDQQTNLEDLNNRLEQRVARKQMRKLPVYYRWTAAAIVLLLAGIGVIKMWQLPEKHEMAKVIVPQDTTAPAAIMNESGQASANLTDKKPGIGASDVPKPLSATPPAEPVMAKKKAMLQSDTTTQGWYANIQGEPAAPAKDMEVAKEVEAAPSVLSGKVAGVNISRQPTAPAPALAPARTRMLRGRVISENDNSGMPGATVAVIGTSKGAITDKDGNFAVSVDSTEKVQLSVNAVGFMSKKLAIGNEENNLNIAIAQQNNSLNEVTVVGYGVQKKSVVTSAQATITSKDIHRQEMQEMDSEKSRRKKAAYQVPSPGEGFESYEKYIAKNVRYPSSAQNITGKVRVAFTVKADGRLENFRVLRKLQPDCDTEAIRVIKEGPAWIPASDGKSTRVQVDVPFAP
ncbi:TonB family C-terminal domain-containing protein [Chitinophaga sp. CF118]|uniref:energy transducer TonB n=1 Tax=Chitinophaga sp. CF118 TaxID=1884367 RepID=UPI0008E19D47|nr:TonB family protein [Chitinophaga sp. CF118]SFE72698.1 TonB family C-terminal domain-containing protein [Chitinophaga sp. CF118]